MILNVYTNFKPLEYTCCYIKINKWCYRTFIKYYWLVQEINNSVLNCQNLIYTIIK